METSFETTANREDLAYFAALQNAHPAEAPCHTAKLWDRRAEEWQKDFVNNRKGNFRVNSALNYLTARGVLQPEYDVVDIGCGPGRFVAAFAQKDRTALGLDLSPKMVAYGKEYLKAQGTQNADLQVCDFQSLDLDAAGWRGAFDLVFSSMTPAIHGTAGLEKLIAMSRAWCCNVSHRYKRNALRERVLQEVLGRDPQPILHGRSGLYFYSTFNWLYLMGYCPETSYEVHHQEVRITPDEDYAAFFTSHMLDEEDQREEVAKEVLLWLKAHAGPDGTILEESDTCYARILWDVRQKTSRQDYRAMLQED